MAKPLTIKEIIKRKAELKNNRNNKQKQTLYIQSLDAHITIEKPDQSIVIDALGMNEGGDNFLVYECVVEPKLKSTELHEEFSVTSDPIEIVNILFEPGEITNIAKKCLELAGYGDSVKVVKQVKN